MISTVFEFVKKGTEPILVHAMATNVDSFEAEDLVIKFIDEDGNKIEPDLNRSTMDEVILQAIEELNENYSVDSLMEYED